MEIKSFIAHYINNDFLWDNGNASEVEIIDYH